MLVKSAILPSKVAGEGVCVTQFVPKGATIWTADPQGPVILTEGARNGDNYAVTKEQARDLESKLSREEMSFIVHHSMWYKDGDVFVVFQDGIGKTNHSNQPTARMVFSKDHDWKKLKMEALKDLQPGDEICTNYSHCAKSQGWMADYVREYDPLRLQLEVDLNISYVPGYYQD